MMIPNVLMANPPLIETSNTIEQHLCVPDSEFYVSGIKPGDSLENILSKLGKPISIQGSKDFPTYHYSNMTIYLCNGVSVGSISFIHPKTRTKSGLRVGIDRAYAYSILGINYSQGNTENQSPHVKRHNLAAEIVNFQNCSDVFSSIKLKFSGMNMLEEVTVGFDCP